MEGRLGVVFLLIIIFLKKIFLKTDLLSDKVRRGAYYACRRRPFAHVAFARNRGNVIEFKISTEGKTNNETDYIIKKVNETDYNVIFNKYL